MMRATSSIAILLVTLWAVLASGCEAGVLYEDVCGDDCRRRAECGVIQPDSLSWCVQDCMSIGNATEQIGAAICYDAKVDLTDCQSVLECADFISSAHGNENGAASFPCKAEKAVEAAQCANHYTLGL